MTDSNQPGAHEVPCPKCGAPVGEPCARWFGFRPHWVRAALWFEGVRQR